MFHKEDTDYKQKKKAVLLTMQYAEKIKRYTSFGFTIESMNKIDSEGKKYCKRCNRILEKLHFTSALDCFSCKFCQKLFTYKLSFDWFSRVIQEQLGLCSICSTQLNDNMCIDHNHACCQEEYSCGNCIRGLLCNRCNIAVGVHENSERLLQSYKYLIQYKSFDKAKSEKLSDELEKLLR